MKFDIFYRKMNFLKHFNAKIDDIIDFTKICDIIKMGKVGKDVFSFC